MTRLRWRALNRGHRMNWLISFLDSISQAVGRVMPVRVNGRWRPFTLNANESISGAAHRWASAGKFHQVRTVINALFFWEDDHCRSSYYADVLRAIATVREAGYTVQPAGFESVKEQV
jgi:hypothetical protein